jgi:hypothetical protein
MLQNIIRNLSLRFRNLKNTLCAADQMEVLATQKEGSEETNANHDNGTTITIQDKESFRVFMHDMSDEKIKIRKKYMSKYLWNTRFIKVSAERPKPSLHVPIIGAPPKLLKKKKVTKVDDSYIGQALSNDEKDINVELTPMNVSPNSEHDDPPNDSGDINGEKDERKEEDGDEDGDEDDDEVDEEEEEDEEEDEEEGAEDIVDGEGGGGDDGIVGTRNNDPIVVKGEHKESETEPDVKFAADIKVDPSQSNTKVDGAQTLTAEGITTDLSPSPKPSSSGHSKRKCVLKTATTAMPDKDYRHSSLQTLKNFEVQIIEFVYFIVALT